MRSRNLVALLLWSACRSNVGHETTRDSATAQAQIDTLWSDLAAAMSAGDTAAVARLYTDGAWFAETGLPTARGRAAIVAGAAGVFQCCVYRESNVQIERTEIAGNLATQFGHYRDVIEPRGETAMALFGRFNAVLERDSLMTWRISRLVVIRDSMARLLSYR